MAELDGKIDRFNEVKPHRGLDAVTPAASARAGLARDAVAMLTQLGEPRLNARRLVDRTLEVDPTIETPENLVAAAFRLRDAP